MIEFLPLFQFMSQQAARLIRIRDDSLVCLFERRLDSGDHVCGIGALAMERSPICSLSFAWLPDEAMLVVMRDRMRLPGAEGDQDFRILEGGKAHAAAHENNAGLRACSSESGTSFARQ
ncbi:MAG TPA: hypothetical protein VFZ59_20190 [Verrucomicrobiae bacterium]|nr:hypothetical protein [Verrucomicrobiae bacterium]